MLDWRWRSPGKACRRVARTIAPSNVASDTLHQALCLLLSGRHWLEAVRIVAVLDDGGTSAVSAQKETNIPCRLTFQHNVAEKEKPRIQTSKTNRTEAAWSPSFRRCLTLSCATCGKTSAPLRAAATCWSARWAERACSGCDGMHTCYRARVLSGKHRAGAAGAHIAGVQFTSQVYFVRAAAAYRRTRPFGSCCDQQLQMQSQV